MRATWRENVGWLVIGLLLGGLLGVMFVSRLEPNPHAWMLVTVMVTGGLLGGCANYFIARTDEPEKASLLTSLSIGVGAALLVPLFLHLLASGLLDLTRTEPLAVLVFLGFCVVAGVSSRAFITTISDRVLRKVEEVEAKAEQAQRAAAEAQAEVKPLVARETEPEAAPAELLTGAGEGTADELAETRGINGNVSEEERLLRALAYGRFALRSLSGLSGELNITPGRVRTVLGDLQRIGLVRSKPNKSDGGERWFITEEGLRALTPEP